MRRIQKIFIGIFLGGVLLGGIGTGIAFVEYSSIAYAGERKIGAEGLVTDDFDFSFEPEKGGILVVGRRYEDGQLLAVEEDEAVPEGVIRYQVTYNPKTVTPVLDFTENAADEDAFADEAEMQAQEGSQPRVQEGSQPHIQEAEESGKETGVLPGTADTLNYQGELRLDSWYHGDDFAIWMENKDEILKDLKQGRIASYRVDYITEVRIKVNPKTMQYVTKVN